jgi:hypothetical protein
MTPKHDFKKKNPFLCTVRETGTSRTENSPRNPIAKNVLHRAANALGDNFSLGTLKNDFAALIFK